MQADTKRTKRLLNIARGQIDGLIRMVDENRYCIDISHQIMATTAILNKLNRDILKAHLGGCVQNAIQAKDAISIEQKMDELQRIIDQL